MRKVLRLMFGIVVMEGTLAKARRDSRGLEGTHAIVCAPAVANDCAFSGLYSCTSTKANGTDVDRLLFGGYRFRALVGNINDVGFRVVG